MSDKTTAEIVAHLRAELARVEDGIPGHEEAVRQAWRDLRKESERVALLHRLLEVDAND